MLPHIFSWEPFQQHAEFPSFIIPHMQNMSNVLSLIAATDNISKVENLLHTKFGLEYTCPFLRLLHELQTAS